VQRSAVFDNRDEINLAVSPADLNRLMSLAGDPAAPSQ
jgi:hypothetical protein